MACKCAAFIRHDFKAPEEFEQVLTAGHCVHLRFRFHLKILEDTQSRASRFDRFDPCFLYFSVRQDGGFGSHISDLFSRAGWGLPRRVAHCFEHGCCPCGKLGTRSKWTISEPERCDKLCSHITEFLVLWRVLLQQGCRANLNASEKPSCSVGTSTSSVSGLVNFAGGVELMKT